MEHLAIFKKHVIVHIGRHTIFPFVTASPSDLALAVDNVHVTSASIVLYCNSLLQCPGVDQSVS